MRTALKSLKGSLRQVQEIPIHSSQIISHDFLLSNNQPITIQQSIQQTIFPLEWQLCGSKEKKQKAAEEALRLQEEEEW